MKDCHICKKPLQIIDHKHYWVECKTDEKYKMVEKCIYCKKEKSNDDTIRDHCHVTGKFRGSAHRGCNLKYKYKCINKKSVIPVISHNIRGYDSHLILKYYKKYFEGPISCIPNNKEKYISFSIDNYVFLDSVQFMASSLDSLVENLKKSAKSFEHLEKYALLQKYSNEQIELLSQKGVYPYDYTDDFAVFDEKCLPPIEKFHSTLYESEVDREDYEHAINVWEKFNLKSFGEYHDLYLMTDVLLLADVFEEFRNVSLNYYRLDPCNFYTSPGIAGEAMLLLTGVKLELFSDIDMYNFCSGKNTRGGICMISKRYAKANNKLMKDYDPNVESSHIIYLDANSLYGWAMCHHMPTGGFQWQDASIFDTPEEFIRDYLNEFEDDGPYGFYVEVDLEYPKELHELHNDYPLAPEKMPAPEGLAYEKKFCKKFNLKKDETMKLIPNLNDKKNYVCHFKYLKMLLKYGLKLTKVHKILEFNQEPWLKKYIDLNTQLRSNAKNDFEKDFFKLMINSAFGKTMENLQKRVNIRLIDNKKVLKTAVAKPTFKGPVQIISEDLVGVEIKKTKILLNNTIYLGMAVLDISKILMADFHYGYIKPKYGNRAELLFTDTDSLCYHIKTEDFEKDIMRDLWRLDTADYPKNHLQYSEINKKVYGKFKEEGLGKVIFVEFIGLRVKMYSLKKCLRLDGTLSDKKVAKGVKKYVISNKLSHEDYKQTLFDSAIKYSTMNAIRSVNHEIQTVEINKTSLSALDTKRAIMMDGVHSLAYEHKDLNAIRKKELEIINDNEQNE